MSTKITEPLLSLLRTTFPDLDDRGIILMALEKERVFSVERARLLTRTDLLEMGLPRGIAAELLAALAPPVDPAPAPQAAPPPTRFTPSRLTDMTIEEILDGLLATDTPDPGLVEFADKRHPEMARGVVLLPGPDKKIDRARTLEYLAQPQMCLGLRWAGQRVVRVSELYGQKEEYNPFDLTQLLQKGYDPITKVDFSGVDSSTRNFLAWVGEYMRMLLWDGGHGLVEALKEKGFANLRASGSRYAIALKEYEEACSDQPGLAVAYLNRLYRTPSTIQPSTTQSLPDVPSVPAGSLPVNPGAPVNLDRTTLMVLRKTLASAYGVERSSMVARDVGLDVSRLVLHGSAENVWGEILREAQNQRATHLLLARLHSDYPGLVRQAGLSNAFQGSGGGR